jgi:methylase of polypeptide subunit release factors
MKTRDQSVHRHRYTVVTEEKAAGATYTPRQLADFVAERIVEALKNSPHARSLRVLDPAVGDGELLVSLLKRLSGRCDTSIEVHGFELDHNALDLSTSRINHLFPDVSLSFEAQSFLEYVVSNFGVNGGGSLFRQKTPETFDIIIANPPYVRTQIMGTHQAQDLAKQFSLSGRVDLYYAFIVAMAQVLNPRGIAGIIVSNRFMTTRSGTSVRQALRQRFNLRHIWDLGDTKLFNAAVLPAVLLVEGKNDNNHSTTAFTSIYETSEIPSENALTPIQALSRSGVIEVEDGRRFSVRHGVLDTSGTADGVWRVATETAETWLDTVGKHTWGTFRDVGKIRVGVKTCADKIFIRSDWQDLPEEEQPELLRPLVTHRIARRFKGLVQDRPQQILYTHEIVEGTRRAVELSRYPRSKSYLERHRASLEAREYVIQAGRKWYEIWVPQDPAAWGETKLVFRDIADAPTFWIDQNGSVVNGDCYWIICERPSQTDLLWLAAAVGNSCFIERFYDYSFQNKLYAGRRRFITQYVERFPLPNPQNSLGQKIIAKAKEIYDCTPSQRAKTLQVDLDQMIWKAFGLSVEKIDR